MRPGLILAVVLLWGCSPASVPVQAPKVDHTGEAWYAETVAELAELNRTAETRFRAGKMDEAAAAITEGQPLAGRLLAVARPTLEAMTAAADLDDLYGRMLLKNGRVGWARLEFQKNLVRWRVWRPETAETVRRRKVAEGEIAECDRRLEQ